MLNIIFDAKELRKYALPDGTIMHSEIQIDDSVIMIAAANDRFPPNHLLLHVFVPEVDGTFNKAIKLGCDPVEAPQQREGEPNRRGAFKDFSGNIWSVATQME